MGTLAGHPAIGCCAAGAHHPGQHRRVRLWPVDAGRVSTPSATADRVDADSHPARRLARVGRGARHRVGPTRGPLGRRVQSGRDDAATPRPKHVTPAARSWLRLRPVASRARVRNGRGCRRDSEAAHQRYRVGAWWCGQVPLRDRCCKRANRLGAVDRESSLGSGHILLARCWHRAEPRPRPARPDEPGTTATRHRRPGTPQRFLCLPGHILVGLVDGLGAVFFYRGLRSYVYCGASSQRTSSSSTATARDAGVPAGCSGLWTGSIACVW